MAATTTLGSRLEHLRARKGLTLEELADKSGVNPEAIRRIERGMTVRPRLRTLYRLVEAMGEDIEELIGEAEAAS